MTVEKLAAVALLVALAVALVVVRGRLAAARRALAEAEKSLTDERKRVAELADDAEAHLRNLERHAADPELASKLQQQVLDRDGENAKLAKELEAAKASLGSMPDELKAIRRTVVDAIVSGLTRAGSAETLARSLQTEMFDAGQSVDNEVSVLVRLGGP